MAARCFRSRLTVVRLGPPQTQVTTGTGCPARNSRRQKSTSVLLNTADPVAGEGIDEAVAWHYGQPAAEEKAFEQGYGLVDLSHYGVIEVTGPQRLEWLNSITSQRLDNLEPGVTVETLVLSVQGRIE